MPAKVLKKRRIASLLAQLALCGLFVALALPLAIAAAVRNPAVREYARQQAEDAIDQQLGLSAVIRDVDIEPSSLALVARGITLDHPQRGRFVEAKQLRIRPSWWSLLRGRIDLHLITIDQATVWLSFDEHGKLLNGPKTKSDPSGKASVDLPFDKLWIKHSSLFVDVREQGHAELRAIDITIDSTAKEVLGIALSSPGGVVKHKAGVDELRAIEARAKLTDENLQVELLRFGSPELSIAVRDTRLQFPLGSSYQGDLDLQMHLPQLLRWPLPVKIPSIAGELHVRAHTEFDEKDGKGPHGEGHVSVHRGQIDQFCFGEDVELNVAVGDQKLGYTGYVRAIRDGGTADISGELKFAPHLPLTLSARIHHVEFAKLMEQLGVSENAIVNWDLNGNWELKGTLDPLDLTGPMRMPTRDFRVTRDSWHTLPERNVIAVATANLAGTVNIKPKGLSLLNVEVGMHDSQLHVSEVLIGFDNQLRVRGVAESLNLADVTPLLDFPLVGKGGFEVVVDGTFMEPHVSGRMHFAELSFDGFPFGDVESDFQLEKDSQAVRFSHLAAKKNSSRYDANDFVLDFSDHKLAINAGLSLEHFTLQDFYEIFHYDHDERYSDYHGTFSGKGQIAYTLGFPGDSPRGTMNVETELEIEQAELSGFAFSAGHFGGHFKWLDPKEGYRGAELSIDRLSLRKGRGTINLSGNMALGGTLDLVAVGDKIAVKDTEGLSERMPELGGSFGVTGTIKGNAALPHAELDISATALSYAGQPLGDARSYVRLTDKDDPWVKEALSWKPGEPPADAPCGHAREGLARGSWAPDPPLMTREGPVASLDAPMAFLVCGQALEGSVRFDMALGRTHQYPLRGELRFAEFPFGRLLPRHRKTAPPEGTLTGSLELHDGTALKPETLAGNLHLDTLKFGQLGVTLQNDGPVIAHFEAGKFNIERAAFVGPSSKLQISGGGSLQDGLGLTLGGSVDLGILPSFSRDLSEASGELELDCKVSGQIARPSVFGQAQIRDANVRFASLPFPVQNIAGRITFSAQRVIFERFDAQLLGGSVSLTGSAALAGRGLGSVRLDIEGDRLAVVPREGIDLLLGGQAELVFNAGDRLPKLTGTVRLDRMRYTRPINVGRSLSDLTKKERADVETYDPDDDMLALDLRVVESEPMHIQNNLIDAEISIDDQKQMFRLVGTDQRFGLLGDMNIRRGTVRIRDRPFEVKEGEISFDSAVKIAPSFDVRATTDVRRSNQLGQTNWHVSVHTWGTPESFQFQLTSDPYLSEDDIALLLAIGMTHTELAQLQTSDVTGTAALEALASVTGVEREVQRALPAIDDVHIASAYSLRAARTIPQLHLGKRIADRVRLDASTGLSESRDFSTGIDYQISDKTSVGAVYTNQTYTSSQIADVGVDLKWRLEFD